MRKTLITCDFCNQCHKECGEIFIVIPCDPWVRGDTIITTKTFNGDICPDCIKKVYEVLGKKK